MIVQYKGIKDVIDKKRGYSKQYIEEHADEMIRIINGIAVETAKITSEIKVGYDETLITQVLVDAIEDLKRIQEFHPVRNANAIKEASYIGYWWIRRRPAFVIGNIADLVIENFSKEKINNIKAMLIFINETCSSRYILPKIFKLSEEVDGCACEENKAIWSKARANLIYFLSYRVDSPKSIEAMLTMSTLHPIWIPQQEFWNGDEEQNN